MKIIIITVKK